MNGGSFQLALVGFLELIDQGDLPQHCLQRILCTDHRFYGKCVQQKYNILCGYFQVNIEVNNTGNWL